MISRVATPSPCLAIAAAAIISAVPLRAQVAAPAKAAALSIPATRAGQLLRLWLDAFDSGDSARMDVYYKKYQPDESVQFALPFRRQTGGFDLLTIERSEPSHLEYTVRERKGPTTAYGVLDVSAGGPLRVVRSALQAMGPDVSAAALRIDGAARARVIDGAIAQLDSFYVFPDVAKRMDDSLRARLARGDYDRYDNGITFAMRLRDDLHDVMHDKHLGMNYSARAFPPAPAPGAPSAPSPADIARQQQRMDDVNCGFVKAEQLEGNVGYLRFDMFADPELCGATASAAMSFLAGTRALVIDLRDNGGGSPAMVAYISSYLFSQRTHLNDLWTRRTGATEEFWTRDTVPGRRFGGEKPVYLLTSSRTFSGGEEFSYNLKTLKRATLVGETTGGGAHPVRGRRIDDHFMIGVPFARAINPITHTNWEGVGVEPDIKVPADQALATALKLAREAPRASPSGIAPTAPAPSHGTVHLDVVHSAALGADKRVAVYLPPSYDREPARRYPVVVYLHGLSGSETDWLSKGGLDAVADSLAAAGTGEAILVMPDGDDGWWSNWAAESGYATCADSLRTEDPSRYCVQAHRYDDWISRDLVGYVDARYRTRADRAHRGIAGLSMGGVGALTLALRHPETFAAAMSHSGVVSALYAGPHPFAAPARYASTLDALIAPATSWKGRLTLALGTGVERWREYEPAVLAERAQGSGAALPAIRFDCGTDDALLDENRALDWELTRLRVPHEYSEWPGAHSWRYWHDRTPQGLAWMLAHVGATGTQESR
jgi:S-formylglutathione hydrolase FrmB